MTVSKRSTVRRSTMAAALVAASAMLLAACGGSESESTSTEATAPAATAAASAAADSAAGFDAVIAEVAALEEKIESWPAPEPLSKPVDVTGKKVFIIPIGDAVPVIQAVRTGMEQALTKAGATTEMCDGKFNPTEVANCLKLATDQKPDAIVTMFIDYAMVPTAFDAATSAGIPVLVGGAVPTGEPPADAPMAFFDLSGQSSVMASNAAKAALANQGEELKALVLRLNDSALTTKNGDAAIATITETCPACVAVPVDFTTATVDKLPSAVSAAIVANPGINALIASPEVYMEPAIAGLNSAGVADQVKLYGGNGDVSGLQRVKDGKQVADAAVAPIFVGWMFTNALMQLLAGDEVLPVVDFTGGRIFTENNTADLTITPEAYMTVDWYASNTDFEQQYLDVWAGK